MEGGITMKVIITNHAEERYNERNSLKAWNLQDLAEEVIRKGRTIDMVRNDRLREKMIELVGAEKGKTIYYHRRLFFIFKGNERVRFLITVINPPKL